MIPSREARGLRGRRRPRLEARTDDGDGAETAGSGEAARFSDDGDDGLLRLAAARRWSSCSWTTGGSGHEQGRLAAAVGRRRKSREVVGGAGWVEKDREGIPRGFGGVAAQNRKDGTAPYVLGLDLLYSK